MRKERKLKKYQETSVDELYLMGFVKSINEFYVDVYGNVKRVRDFDGILYQFTVKPSLAKSGYLQVGSSVDRKAYPIHYLVAYAFYGNRPEGCDVNHKDHNHFNNYFLNLEYQDLHINRKDNLPIR